MATKKITTDTMAIIKAIESSAIAQKAAADSVKDDLAKHTAQDDERFTRLTDLTESIANDVKSLLSSRSFVRGAWKAIVVTAGVVSTVTTILLTYLKGH